MRFWCSQLFEPWSWVPRPYLGVWLIIATAIVHRARVLARARREGRPAQTGRERVWFWLALASFWLASDWPVGTLGAGYLSLVHMLQYMLYTLLVGPLVLLAVPEWRAEELLARWRAEKLVRWLCRPLPAAIIANVILIATHAPFTVDNLRTSQVGSFLLDAVWLTGGLLLWLPIINPVRRLRIASFPVRFIYLFLAAQLAPMVPGGFLTFAGAPLYATYELAPRIGIEPLADQQIAGAIMKVGTLPVIWTVMAVLWARWASQNGAFGGPRSRPAPVPRPVVEPSEP